MKKIGSILFTFLILSFWPFRSFAQLCTDPRPMEEFFCLDVNAKTTSEVSQIDFLTIPYQIYNLYYKEFSKLKYPVVLDPKWESPYFGAGVTFYQNRFTVIYLGGLARIDGMTKNALAALVCHEFGHILGGAPFQKTPGAEWSSSEGQSDFFAASECLPRYLKFLKIDESRFDDLIEEAGFDLFNAIKWPSTETRHEPLVRFQEKDVAVKETLAGYPSSQCRYETFRNRHKRASCWFRGGN